MIWHKDTARAGGDAATVANNRWSPLTKTSIEPGHASESADGVNAIRPSDQIRPRQRQTTRINTLRLKWKTVIHSTVRSSCIGRHSDAPPDRVQPRTDGGGGIHARPLNTPPAPSSVHPAGAVRYHCWKYRRRPALVRDVFRAFTLQLSPPWFCGQYLMVCASGPLAPQIGHV